MAEGLLGQTETSKMILIQVGAKHPILCTFGVLFHGECE